MEDNEAVVDGLVPHVNWALDSDGEEDRKDTEITWSFTETSCLGSIVSMSSTAR